MSESFGDRLRRLRDAAGLSQPQLARAAGVSQSAVSGLETGRRPLPSVKTARALAAALNVTLDELLGDESRRSLRGKSKN